MKDKKKNAKKSLSVIGKRLKLAEIFCEGDFLNTVRFLEAHERHMHMVNLTIKRGDPEVYLSCRKCLENIIPDMPPTVVDYLVEEYRDRYKQRLREDSDLLFGRQASLRDV